MPLPNEGQAVGDTTLDATASIRCCCNHIAVHGENIVHFRTQARTHVEATAKGYAFDGRYTKDPRELSGSRCHQSLDYPSRLVDLLNTTSTIPPVESPSFLVS